MSTNLNSISNNIKIIRSDVVTEVQTPILSLMCVRVFNIFYHFVNQPKKSYYITYLMLQVSSCNNKKKIFYFLSKIYLSLLHTLYKKFFYFLFKIYLKND